MVVPSPRNFVNGVLERERLIAEQEEAPVLPGVPSDALLAEKLKAKKKAMEFTEALKLEMARKAASEEELLRLQDEESERQWQKRYAQLKHQLREQVKTDIAKERGQIEQEMKRLEEIEKQRRELRSSGGLGSEVRGATASAAAAAWH
eukprot:Skav232375  [mRNA]  locus=scaffold1077:74029:81434:+ [translate_table: standard]